MTTWILTVGDSDVLLTTAAHWNTLERQTKARCRNLPHFIETKLSTPGGGKLFSYPARALGLVYADQLEQHSDTLRFPRIEALLQQLAQCQPQPRRILVLLTDQSNLFRERDRQSISPYWRDTCELEPLLRFYLDQALPNATQEYLLVRPEASHPGLDHWDNTLSLIQALLSQVKCPPKKPIYVSHQAGTPALSSAVQFVTLTQFGSQVQFLVSNEFHANSSELIPSSTYLLGIRLQEARRLLHRYDYAGLQDVLEQDLSALEPGVGQKISGLLKSAIFWNQAQFSEFANSLPHGAPERTQYWWWTAYESAYLAVIRLEQGNTVEALFHSFRAAEGLLSEWAKWRYPDDIEITKTGALKAMLRANSQFPTSFKNKLEDKKDGLMLYSGSLFELFRTTRPEADEQEDVKVVWGKAQGIRNQQFHRLLGLEKKDVFRAWGTKETAIAWQQRILNCLNFITEQQFQSLLEASLVAAVHQELEENLLTNL